MKSTEKKDSSTRSVKNFDYRKLGMFKARLRLHNLHHVNQIAVGTLS